MDEQAFDLLQARFDTLDKRFDTLEASDKTQVALLYGIENKVAVNQTHITWLKWSLRGVWGAIAAAGGWVGLR